MIDIRETFWSDTRTLCLRRMISYRLDLGGFSAAEFGITEKRIDVCGTDIVARSNTS